MIFVFGGSFQGKKAFARERFGIKKEEELSIEEALGKNENVDLESIFDGKKLIWGLEVFCKEKLAQGENPLEIMEKLLPWLKNKVIVVQDMSCGLVPMERSDREWRECLGRVSTMLSQEADEVYRVFCGTGIRLER